MRYLLVIIIFLLPASALAITGNKTRFDWVLGQPAITDDATSACNDTAVARFDWSLGQPTIVHDATANCTLAEAAVTVAAPRPQIIWFDGVVYYQNALSNRTV